MIYTVQSIEETNGLAVRVARKMKGGEIILLNGDLGTGKTTFTKAFCAALGVKETVTSPTFTFMKSYKGNFLIYHFDLYRAGDEDELYELGLKDYFYEDDSVCLIEWNKFTDLPRRPITVTIERIGDNSRRFNVDGVDL